MSDEHGAAGAVEIALLEGERFAVEDAEHLLEVVAMRGRACARRDVHVDQRVTPGVIAAGQQDRVSVADDTNVLQ